MRRGEVPACSGFLKRVDALTNRPGGQEALAVRLAGQALRGRLPRVAIPSWQGVTSVSGAGGRLLALAASEGALAPAARIAFDRYREALGAGGEAALPFTAQKIVGYLHVYSARWAQSSASLHAIVDNLRRYADFGFEFLTVEDETRRHSRPAVD